MLAVRMIKPASVGVSVLAISLWLAIESPAQLSDTFTNWIEHPAIGYRTRPVTDPVARLNRDINASLTEPGLTARYAELGAVPLIFTLAQASERIASDTQKWAKVVEGAGLKPE